MPGELPIRVRLAIAADRWYSRLSRAIGAALSGFWLGILDSDHLAMKTAAACDRGETSGNDHHNLSGLFAWEQQVVNQHFPIGARVLVPSAGAGREVLALYDLGYEVIGFDPSPALVETGQRLLADTGSRAQLLLSPPDEIPDNLDGDFQAVLVGWGGIHAHSRSGGPDRFSYRS